MKFDIKNIIGIILLTPFICIGVFVIGDDLTTGLILLAIGILIAATTILIPYIKYRKVKNAYKKQEIESLEIEAGLQKIANEMFYREFFITYGVIITDFELSEIENGVIEHQTQEDFTSFLYSFIPKFDSSPDMFLSKTKTVLSYLLTKFSLNNKFKNSISEIVLTEIEAKTKKEILSIYNKQYLTTDKKNNLYKFNYEQFVLESLLPLLKEKSNSFPELKKLKNDLTSYATQIGYPKYLKE